MKLPKLTEIYVIEGPDTRITSDDAHTGAMKRLSEEERQELQAVVNEFGIDRFNDAIDTIQRWKSYMSGDSRDKLVKNHDVISSFYKSMKFPTVPLYRGFVYNEKGSIEDRGNDDISSWTRDRDYAAEFSIRGMGSYSREDNSSPGALIKMTSSNGSKVLLPENSVAKTWFRKYIQQLNYNLGGRAGQSNDNRGDDYSISHQTWMREDGDEEKEWVIMGSPKWIYVDINDNEIPWED